MSIPESFADLPLDPDEPYQPDLYGQRWAPVLIAARNACRLA